MNVNGGSGTAAAVLPPTVGDIEAAKLRGLLDDVRAAERHLARAVLTAGELAASGVSERVEGLPLELLLSLACRITGADRRMLVTAGEVLADMPATGRLFTEGALSWGQVRAIVCAVRRLSSVDRAEVDARVAASAERYEGIDAYDPDQLVWAVDQAVEQLRDRRSVERAEQRKRQSSFLSIQSDFDGGFRLYGQYDAVTGAPILNALDAAAAPPLADDEQQRPGEWSPTPRSRQLGEALTGICADWLGGDSKRPARPLLVAHVDLSQLERTTDGTVELAVRGDLPRVTAATLEALAASGDVRAVVFDGARPQRSVVRDVDTWVAAARLDASAALAFAERRGAVAATRARDTPHAHTDVHHMVHREHGGDHHPENLISLSRRHHTMAHRHGWRLRISPDTGIVSAKRRHRTWRSLPRGTPLASPRDVDTDDPAHDDPLRRDLPF